MKKNINVDTCLEIVYGGAVQDNYKAKTEEQFIAARKRAERVARYCNNPAAVMDYYALMVSTHAHFLG